MEPTDPGQGQEKPSAQNQELTLSSKGRQRKKNPKYTDFETVDKSPAQNPLRKSLRVRRTPSKTSPAKSEDKEATDKAAQESNGKTSEETPKKATRAKRTPSKKTPAKKSPTKKTPVKKTPAKKTPVKKTPVKKTPAKKTPAKKTPARKTPNADGLTGEGGAVHAGQQENGTPKPKTKHVKKQPAQKTLVTEAEEEQGEDAVQPEEAVGPGGRRRRGAATAALKYLQILAKEVFGNSNDDSEPGANSKVATDAKGKNPKGSKVRQGKKRKRCVSDSNVEDDEDFVPGAEEDEVEEMEEEEEEEVEESDLELDFRNVGRRRAVFHINRNTYSNATTSNGLSMKIMGAVWSNFETTKKFREEHYSSWVFPEWVPSTNDWHLVTQSDVEKYLPQEPRSAAFQVSREGLGKEETPLQSLNRFEAVPAHRKCWDMLLYAGGPVWAMEWCPTPDGAPATQYIALACHRGMDDRHYVNKTYTEPGLIQLWDVGKMEYNSSPDSQPTLAYGLAQDKGFIWNLKWCPAGGWELPSCGRKAPFLPRLGLLAAASSTGVVTIYSLPHPAALHSNKKLPDSGNVKQQLPIYQTDGVLTLKLGSLKAPRHENSGQVLSMDWLPEKPHNVIAIGFYDGIVGLWDLSTKSTLLQMRESDGSLSLLPYRCLLAHDHAVRALAFCPASR
nr:PREDICTED: general transcription factor 3C polypeptide 2-like [Paralichthys olivaceus]